MDKKELRSKYKEIRKSIKDKKEQSLLLTDMLMNEDYYRDANVIALYVSLDDEVNTRELIIRSLLLDKRVCLPVVIDDRMEFYYINDINELRLGSFNIYEPSKEEKVNINDIDLMILPGICFDKNNNRIGYGKAFYDRYLVNSNNIFKVGLSFRETFIDNIPVDDNDIRLDITLHL